MAAANARRLLAAGACPLIGVRARIARRRGSRGDASAHVPRVSMLVGRHAEHAIVRGGLHTAA